MSTFLANPVAITVTNSAPEERSLQPVAAPGTCSSYRVSKPATRPSEHHRSVQQQPRKKENIMAVGGNVLLLL